MIEPSGASVERSALDANYNEGTSKPATIPGAWGLPKMDHHTIAGRFRDRPYGTPLIETTLDFVYSIGRGRKRFACFIPAANNKAAKRMRQLLAGLLSGAIAAPAEAAIKPALIAGADAWPAGATLNSSLPNISNPGTRAAP